MDARPSDEKFYRTLLTQLLVQPPDVVENERLEIKGWCRDERELIDKAVDAACCIANAEGGHVLVGIDEDGPRRFSRCPHGNVSPNWLTLRIQDQTHPPVAFRCLDLSTMLADVRGTAGANAYALEIDRKRFISGHTNSKGISRIRVGKECRVQYTADDDRTNAIVPDVTTADLSLESIHWAMSQHRRNFSSLGAMADPWEFPSQTRLLQDPGHITTSCEGYGVTLAALILFGKQAALAKALPYCQTVLKIPGGHEVIRKNVVESLRDLLVGEQARLRQLATVVPPEATHEILVNAYMHRCWRTNGPVIITVADGSVDIENPGDLLPGLHVDNLIYCVPVYRNLLLAEALRFIALADKIGQGVDIVFKSLICAGLGFPSFESRDNRFFVRFSLHQTAEFQEFIRHRGASLPYLDELVLLRFLWGRDEATLVQLSAALQRGKESVQRCLTAMETKSMVEPVDGSRFRLARAVRHDIESIFSRDTPISGFPSGPGPINADVQRGMDADGGSSRA